VGQAPDPLTLAVPVDQTDHVLGPHDARSNAPAFVVNGRIADASFGFDRLIQTIERLA